MADAIPPKLRQADISRFIHRANQLRQVKPAVSYWCDYAAVNQILAKELHTSDEQCLNFTTALMDRLEKVKTEHADDDAITDDMVGCAYVEEFAQQTFERGERVLRANKVTRQTADTFDAAATFFQLRSIWEPIDDEMQKKIVFSKWNAARILKAIKEGKDPNESNPLPPELEEEALPSLDPNDPEVRGLDGPAGDQAPATHLPDVAGVSLSGPPFPEPPSPPPPPPAAPRSDSGYPGSRQSLELGQPSPPQFGYPPATDLAPPSPLSQHSTDLLPSAPQNLPAPHAGPGPSGFSGGFPYAADVPPPPHEPTTFHGQAPSAPSAPNSYYSPSGPLSLSPSAPPPAAVAPPHHPPSQPPSTPPVSAPRPYLPGPPPSWGAQAPPPQQPHYGPTGGPPGGPTDGGYGVTGDFASRGRTAPVSSAEIAKAQKHAKWAISALNFEDVPTAVKELRNALASLGGL